MTIREFLFGLRDRIVHRSQVGKEKLDTAFARRELDRRLLDLGERYHQMVQEGRAGVPDDLRALVNEVEALARRVAIHHEQLRRLEDEAAT